VIYDSWTIVWVMFCRSLQAYEKSTGRRFFISVSEMVRYPIVRIAPLGSASHVRTRDLGEDLAMFTL
jgi:hypothetical protein